jgi:alkylation response protein AidB-like acyl-CoA dehydrogenase
VDFELTTDQEDLRDAVRKFCSGRFPMEQVRALAEVGGVDRALWAELGETGVFGLRQAEDAGGVGLGSAEAVLVFEELGRALVPGPLVASHLAAGVVDGAVDGSAVVAVIERPTDGPAVIEYLGVADQLVVVTEDGVELLDGDTARGAGQAAEPATDPLTPVHIVEQLPSGESIGDNGEVRRWRREGALLSAAMAAGSASATCELATAYAAERKQFNRPIGSFQAVKHILADMLVRAELAKVAVEAAGVALDQPGVADIDQAVSAAKVTACEAAITNARACVQVHGGMGFTWEVDAHLHLKRAWIWDLAFGTAEAHAERLATRTRP